MTENYKKVLELISDNEELKSKIEAIEKEPSSIEEIIDKINSLIKESNLSLSLDDFEGPTAEGEMSDDELEAVAGGKMVEKNGVLVTNCACALGGGGKRDKYQKRCGCVAAGYGELTDEGRGAYWDKKLIARNDSSNTTPFAMVCILAGF